MSICPICRCKLPHGADSQCTARIVIESLEENRAWGGKGSCFGRTFLPAPNCGRRTKPFPRLDELDKWN
jgi:hypothetical protein